MTCSRLLMRRIGEEMKFILMSGHASSRIEGNGVGISLYPFLKKPLDIETLIEKVSSVLETKE